MPSWEILHSALDRSATMAGFCHAHIRLLLKRPENQELTFSFLFSFNAFCQVETDKEPNAQIANSVSHKIEFVQRKFQIEHDLDVFVAKV